MLFYLNESRFGFYFISDATSSLPPAMFKLIGMNSIRTSLTTPRGTVQRGGHFHIHLHHSNRSSLLASESSELFTVQTTYLDFIVAL
jgi:hypothetical protein